MLDEGVFVPRVPIKYFKENFSALARRCSVCLDGKPATALVKDSRNVVVEPELIPAFYLN